MLQIDKVQQLEGVTVFGDDQYFYTFYLLPQQPRFRRDENGNLAFKFIKYRLPVDRPDGKKGGGYVLFDSEFVVPEDKLPKIKEALQDQVRAEAQKRRVEPVPEVRIGTITYTWGETQLNIAGGDGVFVQKVFNPGVPSMFGNNVCTFSVELTPEGATMYEQALQGKGGFVGVVYKLKFWAKLPAMTARGWFNSTQFYSFFQTIDVEWRVWREDDYRETIREQMISSQSMGVEVDPGGVTDQKIIQQVRDWVTQTLEDAVEKKMIEALTPVPDDQRTLPDGIENVTRDVTKTRIDNINISYKEKSTVEWFVAPQGILPNITSLLDAEGKPVKWEDYAVTVDLDDPFFKQLRVDTYVNADFVNLPIHSVEVKVLYRGKPMPNLAEGAPEGEVVLKKPDDVGHFATYVEGDNWKYKYSYQVNYKGTSQIFQSGEIETDEGILTIGVDDVGILSVNIAAGDLNWDQVSAVQVRLTYEDPGENVGPLEDQFTLDKDHPAHLFQKVIFKPFRKSYEYSVKYFMKDGKEYQSGVQSGRATNLFINDPFAGTRTVRVIATGDLKTRISNIFVDLTYTDEANDYVQTKSVALNSNTPFFDWSIPVIGENLGKVSYSSVVMLVDGTSRTFAPQESESGQILVPRPPVGYLDVTVNTDLLDFATYKLVRVSLSYEDAENLISERKDMVFTPTKKVEQTWQVPLADATKKQYTWQATFFMNDNTQKTSGGTTSDAFLILEVPA